MAITIVGLGPGDPALLTRQAWDVLSQATEVYLRTRRHPTVEGLPTQVGIHSFDELYEQADDFDHVYAAIVGRVLELGRPPAGVVYAVPGHPLVGEATVTALLEQAAAQDIPVHIVAGLSFVEPVLTALRVDGMAGLQVADALDVAMRLFPPFNPDAPALLGQLYSRALASDVKLTLMNQYPDEHGVFLVHAAGTAAEEVEAIPLYALDHSVCVAHLTSLYVPPLERPSGLASFQETIARLRGPGGCPWDQQQTHQSLRAGLVEETAEVLDALDADDMEALCEELGDLLLHIVMHTQIAAEDGDFSAADVVAGIDAKIKRRHPHVFGDASVDSVGEVLENWETIKQQERGGEQFESVMDGIPAALSALAQADKISRRAVRTGFDWPDLAAVVAKVQEELGELLAAPPQSREEELGDLLFSLVNWGRWLGLDADAALRAANRRFHERFRMMERMLQVQGLSLAELGPGDRKALWRKAKGH